MLRQGDGRIAQRGKNCLRVFNDMAADRRRQGRHRNAFGRA